MRGPLGRGWPSRTNPTRKRGRSPDISRGHVQRAFGLARTAPRLRVVLVFNPERNPRRCRPLRGPERARTPSRAPAAVAGNGPSAGPRAAGRVHSRSSEWVEERTREIGRELFERIGRGPKPWQRAWWEDRFVARDSERPAGAGSAFPVHRRAAGPQDQRRGPPAPGRVPGRGG